MKSFYELKEELYNEISNIQYIKDINNDFEDRFFQLIDKINFLLIDDSENFYGYFLLKMDRKIKYDVTSPTAISLNISGYTIYFNPILFLMLDLNQMKTSIKHEIIHIISLHLVRGKELKNKFSTLAINMAMDIVVNQYLDYLPPYATTIEWVNLKYNLALKPYRSMEEYILEIQKELDLLDDNKDGEEEDTKENDSIEKEYDVARTHDSWGKSDFYDEKIVKSITQKIVNDSKKNNVDFYVENILSDLNSNNNKISWNLYLKKIMGTLEKGRKKTITRRNRRQPNRLDLRGELSNHIARIVVAIDISGSISDEEFNEAINEVLNIVKNYKYEITIIECDTKIRRTYKVKISKDIKDRLNTRGGTSFSPVFKYVNNTDTNILIYFTDGKGERELEVKPGKYKTLWIISGKGDELSLENKFGVIKKLKDVKSKEDTIDMMDIRSDGWSMNNQQPIL
ncbi:MULTISPECIES: VWA-like domain-containing protein [Clostridium]|uniref:Uncharacterized protein n=1 Tax=Clostridium senegalense TaxID=1465809 RepID=A0A6M0H050_9CLOT|nr:MULTISPECIES: VWA-like domain-containing protein [Clostridium]NEU03453.1 hypothetical protein [Clostridium senegalense]